MAEDKDERECVMCDRVLYAGVVLAAGVVTFLALDLFTQGGATAWLSGKVRPVLAQVVPIRGEAQDSDADAS